MMRASKEVKRFLSKIGKKGGVSKSSRKKAAVTENAKKGGWPWKGSGMNAAQWKAKQKEAGQ